MKSILLQVPESLKHKLEVLRAQGYSINGYIRGVLERDLASRPGDLKAEHLSKKQIERIEEAMNTDDLEFMVATVDAIVEKRQIKPMTKHQRVRSLRPNTDR